MLSKEHLYKMNTIFMNSKNTKTTELQKWNLYLPNKTDLKTHHNSCYFYFKYVLHLGKRSRKNIKQ